MATGLPTFITVKYLPEVAEQTPWLNGHRPGAGVTVTVKPVTALIQRASSLESKYGMTEETAKGPAVMTKQAPQTANRRLTTRAIGRFELPGPILTLGRVTEETAKRLVVMTKQAPQTANRPLTTRAIGRFELPESFLTLGVLLSRDSKHEDSSASCRRSLL